MSREGKSTPTIHIIPFNIFATVVLSVLVTGFLIWKDLVISSATSNNGPVDGEGTIGPTDVEGLADAKESVDVEKSIPVDTKKPVVICYKHSY